MLEIRIFKREFLEFHSSSRFRNSRYGDRKKANRLSELPDSLRMLIRDGKDALGEVQQVDIQMISSQV